jgi:hypothetical protein
VKRLASALVLGLLVLALAGTPALASAHKVNLAPSAENGVTTGMATAIFNNSSGVKNLQVTVQVKGANADFTYAMYLFVDGAWYHGAPVGTVMTDGDGNATFHFNGAVAAGSHLVGMDVAIPVTGADQYLAVPGIMVEFR